VTKVPSRYLKKNYSITRDPRRQKVEASFRNELGKKTKSLPINFLGPG